MRSPAAGGLVSSFRSPLPEAFVGLALAALILAASVQLPGMQRAILGLSYLALLLWMAIGDVRTLRVPNRLVCFTLGFGVAGSLILGRADAVEALLGGLAGFGVLFPVALAGRGAMGFGDVKVAGVCGIAVGLHGVLPLIVLAFASGGLVALGALAARLRKRGDVVAFTPFLVAATMVSMLSFDLYLWR